VGALALAACGSSGGGAKTSTAAGVGFPVTVRAANGTVTVTRRPTRIVSLSPTATEMLFAVGAGAQVVAVDSDSNFPSRAPKTSLSGFTPNVEAIAGYRPDLVVASNDTGGVVDGLRRLSIATLLEPAAKVLRDTGHESAATALVRRMRTQIAALTAQAPKQPTRTYYHELDNTLFSVTSDTFIGQLYSLAGLRDIADATGDKAGGYPQLSAEFVLQANPDFVFLADTKCCSQSAASVAARPGWAGLKAVKEGHVVALDDDVASRWGPRVVDLLRTIIDAVRRAGPGG